MAVTDLCSGQHMLSNCILSAKDTLKGDSKLSSGQRPHLSSPKWESSVVSVLRPTRPSPCASVRPQQHRLGSHPPTTRPQPSFSRKPASMAVGSVPAELH